MLTNKTFVRKTRKGNVVKIVREHYLRDDIWCGSQKCTLCSDPDPWLQGDPKSQSSLLKSPHYILPDTNVVLHQIDVLQDPVFTNVIILQTVVQELRHRHAPSHTKLKEIITNKDRHFYSFTNEHHKETYVERLPGESSNDRSDRAIRVATKWYNTHLASSKTKLQVVLLTNDRENLSKALDDGILAFTFREYVEQMKDHPSLLDKLAQIPKNSNDDGSVHMTKNKKIFPEHWNLSQIQQEIKNGNIHQGKFSASRDNYLEGTVFIEDDETNAVLIQGLNNLNRAVHDDLVAIEIYPKEQWVTPAAIILEDDNDNAEDDVLIDEVLNKTKKISLEEAKPTGRIVGIIKRNWRSFCGTLQPSNIKEASRHLFMPADRRIPKIRIETRQAATLQGQRIIVSIDGWAQDSRYPNGHFVKNLGPIGDKNTENQVLLLEHDVPHLPFSQAVLACLPQMPWEITKEEESKRKDLRHIAICSVDPPGCTDIDDALHCFKLENGNYQVGVHIADVSHFIRPGTAIDKEASERGTTVYLVDQRIDMVPELLSSNLCSLRGNEERYAFSCIWEITPQAEVLSTFFCKSIIKSSAALTYAEAQLRIDDSSMTDDVTESLRGLNRLAKILKRKRIDNGALTLASSEIRFNLDSETHDPIDVKSKELRDTNSMVEEFMLLANISSAKRILEEFPDCSLLRRHPVPPPGNYETLLKAGKSMGFEIDIHNGKSLAASLDKAVIPSNPFFNVMLRMVATRCMTQAVYFSSGTLPEEDYFHYGLAVPIYTHFTSPIRRYSDIIVHRLLAVAIGADYTYSDLLDKKKTQVLCNNLNFRHKMGQYAGRASVNLYTHIYYKDRSVVEEGYILFVRINALQILLPSVGLECTLYLKNKKEIDSDVKFTFNEQGPSQIAGDVELKQFDPVKVLVSIESVGVQHQKLDIKLVSPVIPGFSVEVDEAKSPPKKKIKSM